MRAFPLKHMLWFPVQDRRNSMASGGVRRLWLTNVHCFPSAELSAIKQLNRFFWHLLGKDNSPLHVLLPKLTVLNIYLNSWEFLKAGIVLGRGTDKSQPLMDGVGLLWILLVLAWQVEKPLQKCIEKRHLVERTGELLPHVELHEQTPLQDSSLWIWYHIFLLWTSAEKEQSWSTMIRCQVKMFFLYLTAAPGPNSSSLG